MSNHLRDNHADCKLQQMHVWELHEGLKFKFHHADVAKTLFDTPMASPKPESDYLLPPRVIVVIFVPLASQKMQISARFALI